MTLKRSPGCSLPFDLKNGSVCVCPCPSRHTLVLDGERIFICDKHYRKLLSRFLTVLEQRKDIPA